MSGLLKELKTEFATNDKEYRHAYADESLNGFIGTQIKVLREQQKLTQEELAVAADMKQPMISRYENANYSSWSLNTLKKLAVAFDVCLDVRFRSFGELVETVDGFSRESLQVPKFVDDPFFKEAPATAVTITIPVGNLTSTFGTWSLSNETVQSSVSGLVTTDHYTTILGGGSQWLNPSLTAEYGLDPKRSLFYNMTQEAADVSPIARQLNEEQDKAKAA